jgi:hypothetical protein
MTIIDNKYNIGDTVYLKTDPEQKKRLVFAFEIRIGQVIVYWLSCGAESSPHYEFEISSEVNILEKTEG